MRVTIPWSSLSIRIRAIFCCGCFFKIFPCFEKSCYDSFVLLFMNNGLIIFYYVSVTSLIHSKSFPGGALVCKSRKEIRLVFSLLLDVTFPILISLNPVFLPSSRSLWWKTSESIRGRKTSKERDSLWEMNGSHWKNLHRTSMCITSI